MVRSIGADHVIDYTQDDFTEGDRRYDFILDNVGSRSMADTRRALNATGTLLTNGARSGRLVRGSDRSDQSPCVVAVRARTVSHSFRHASLRILLS